MAAGKARVTPPANSVKPSGQRGKGASVVNAVLCAAGIVLSGQSSGLA